MASIERDQDCMRRAIAQAKTAYAAGNLPIGAVITLDGAVIAEGRNAIWVPHPDPDRHAEMEALGTVPHDLWARAAEMTLYTTLEPCLMCLSTILLHRIARVIYGAPDDRGGAACVLGHMPPAFEERARALQLIGPSGPQECADLAAAAFARLDAVRQLPAHERRRYGE